MIERKARRVEGVPIELERSAILARELAVGAAREEAFVRPIKFVADDGQAKAREVDADLMLATGLERAADEGVARAVGGARTAADDLEPRGGGEARAQRGDVHLHFVTTGEIELEW